MKKIIFIITLLSIIIIGCRPWGIKGNGNVIVEERNITSFNKVSVSGIFHVKIVSGKDFGVKIRAEENLMKYIETFKEGKTLYIETKRHLSPKKKMQVKITMPELLSIESSGVNKILAKNIETEKLDIDLSGAGEIKLVGRVDKLNADISGASELNAIKLKCSEVNIDISGASHAIVNAREALFVDASGASSVKYLGNPEKLVTDVSGVSSVKRIKGK